MSRGTLPAASSHRALAPFGAWVNFTGEMARRNVSFRAGVFHLKNRIGGMEKNVFNVPTWAGTKK
jgi:hypothetical protein